MIKINKIGGGYLFVLFILEYFEINSKNIKFVWIKNKSNGIIIIWI